MSSKALLPIEFLRVKKSVHDIMSIVTQRKEFFDLDILYTLTPAKKGHWPFTQRNYLIGGVSFAFF